MGPHLIYVITVLLVQYLTHSIFLSYTWVKGGDPFWVANETVPCHISTLKDPIRPNLGKLYNLSVCSFQVWSFSERMTVKGRMAASIPWSNSDFLYFWLTWNYCWLRDLLIFNVKFFSQIFICIYTNLSALKYKQKTIFRKCCCHSFPDIQHIKKWPN